MREMKEGLALAALVATTAYGRVGATEELVGAELGLRTGYAIPFGKIRGDDPEDMSDHIGGAVPFWFDLGYRPSPRLMLGGYFQYALGIPGSGVSQGCEQAGADCSSRVAKERLGVTLDTTYTGKAFACVLDVLKGGGKANVLYWHTLSSAPLEPLLAEAPARDALPAKVLRLLG